MVIAADPPCGNPPFIAPDIKQWVETRGGDYFFVPSMTALRMIGIGDRRPDLNSEHCAKRWVPAFRKKQCGNKGL